MLRFILRRLVVSVFILLGALFIVYWLVAISKSPLEDILQSTAPNKLQLIEARSDLLDLDVPPPARFFIWLGGMLGFFVGNGTWGLNILGQEVGTLLPSIVGQTLQLVTAATIIAIVVGIAVGVATALRQYSGFDYAVTFVSFLLYSLPVFFIAVILKLYIAIGFNDFLQAPEIPIGSLLLIGVIVGIVVMSIVGGPMKQRLIAFGAGLVGTAAILEIMQLLDWFRQPSLGIPLLIILGLTTVLVVAALSVGVRHRRNLIVTGAVAISAAVLWYPLQFAMTNEIGLWFPIALVVVYAVLGWAAGHFFGGVDRLVIRKNAAIVGFVMALLLVLDRIMQVWPDYMAATGDRPIATVGATNPQFAQSDNIWLQLLDGFTHLLLPTLSIAFISIAQYSRYSRASLLDVMNMDYVRTARAKGLPERTVVMRHALRNALIPVTTVVAADVGAIISGAIVTERIFGWRAMGTLFSESLAAVDLNPLMAYMLITASLTVIFNLIADILYSVLDPRIRLS